MRQDYRVEVIEGITELGVFNKSAWIKEADSHMFSSELLHAHSVETRRKLSLLIDEEKSAGKNTNRKEITNSILEVESSAKSSILLLGYSIESYLKSGLVCLHQNTTREDFFKLLKNKYSHDLRQSSEVLGLELSGGDKSTLDRIRELVLDEARYPVTPSDSRDYISQLNKLSSEIWSIENYERLLKLSKKIKGLVKKIDSDSSNPAIFARYKIDKDGYCAFRVGGNLPPYILVRYSTVQVEEKTNTEKDLLDLLVNNAPDEQIQSVIASRGSEFSILNLRNTKKFTSRSR